MDKFFNAILPHQFVLFSAVLIVVSLPFGKNFSTIPMVLLITSWLFYVKKEDIIQLLKERFFWIFTALFWMALIGVAFADNTARAAFIIKLYLPLLIFPVVFFTTTISKQNLLFIFRWFIIGAFVATVWCLLLAAYHSYNGEKNTFFYTKLSIIHPTYFATYLNFVLILLGNYFATQFKKISFLKKILLSFLIVYFIIFILLLSSRVAIISIAFVFNGLIIFHYFKKNFTLSTFLILLSLNFIPLLVAYNSPIIKKRFAELQQMNKMKDSSIIENSTNSRIIIWKAAFSLIKENFWTGVGSGDVTDELVKTYAETDFKKGQQKRYNAHNQYLQVWLAYGVFGFVIFLSGFYLFYAMAIKNEDGIYLIFLILTSLVFLTETFLNSQSGVVFFAFFNSLLFAFNKTKAIK
jgi:O-antigen ligase